MSTQNRGTAAEETPEKLADTLPGVHDLFRKRWSPRSFSDRPVSNHDLLIVLEAARWASSSSNEQPWRFVVTRKSDGVLHERLLAALTPSNQAWAKSAPVLLLTVAKETFTQTGATNLYARHDTGGALAHLSLQATALGLHVHSMAGFDGAKARKDLGIPEGYEPIAVVALGYLGSPDTLSETQKERELAPRKRKPLSQLVFGGEWDRPLEL